MLDIAAVALRLGVKPATVRQHLWRGTIPPPDARIGGHPAWEVETIQRWQRARRKHRNGMPRQNVKCAKCKRRGKIKNGWAVPPAQILCDECKWES